MKLFRDLEKQIDSKLRRIFGTAGTPEHGGTLIEVQRVILDRIEERVQSLPRARRVFPYNEVTVRIPVPDAEQLPAYEMVFGGDNLLRDEIADALRRDNVEFPHDLAVNVSLMETADVTEPVLAFRKTDSPAPVARPGSSAASAAQRGVARFTPLPDGTPVETTKARIHVGRMAEVLDDRRRPVRRNDLVLDEKTVSRAHAHIEVTSGEYRIFDDGSSYGTSVVHEGTLVEAPRPGTRGLRLWPGDEIYFGQARVRFEIIEP